MHEVLAFVRVMVTQLPDTETGCLRTLPVFTPISSDSYRQISLLMEKSPILEA